MRVGGRFWVSLLFFTMFAGLFFLIVIQPQLAHLNPLVAEGRRTTGKIVAVDSRNHGVRSYEYVVDGRRFTGKAADAPNEIGSRVDVYYLPRAPEHSSVGDVREKRDTLVRDAWKVCPGLGLIIALLVWWRYPEALERLSRTWTP